MDFSCRVTGAFHYITLIDDIVVWIKCLRHFFQLLTVIVFTYRCVSNEKLQKCCYWLSVPISPSVRIRNKLKSRGTGTREISYY
jgi:hypothetical protein